MGRLSGLDLGSGRIKKDNNMTVGERIIQGAKEALAYVDGGCDEALVYHVYVPPKHPAHIYNPNVFMPTLQEQLVGTREAAVKLGEEVIPTRLRVVRS